MPFFRFLCLDLCHGCCTANIGPFSVSLGDDNAFGGGDVEPRALHCFTPVDTLDHLPCDCVGVCWFCACVYVCLYICTLASFALAVRLQPTDKPILREVHNTRCLLLPASHPSHMRLTHSGIALSMGRMFIHLYDM